MIVQSLVFYLFAVLAAVSAVLVIVARNPVHAVLWLVLAFFNTAGLFLLLGAEFLAMLLIIVYVGAVAVLFLFAVMMLDINTLGFRERMASHLSLGVAVGAVLLAELGVVFGLWQGAAKEEGALRLSSLVSGSVPNVKALGAIIYTDYAYLFQVAGLILLTAMIGAIVLTHRRRSGVKRQVVSEQLDRSNTISLKNVPTRGGI